MNSAASPGGPGCSARPHELTKDLVDHYREAKRLLRTPTPAMNLTRTCYQGSQNGTTLHQPPQMPAARRFYPNFYPKTQRGRVEMLYLLVTAANWNGRSECAT